MSDTPKTRNVTLDEDAFALVMARVRRAKESSGIEPSRGAAASALIKESAKAAKRGQR